MIDIQVEMEILATELLEIGICDTKLDLWVGPESNQNYVYFTLNIIECYQNLRKSDKFIFNKFWDLLFEKFGAEFDITILEGCNVFQIYRTKNLVEKKSKG